MNKVTVAIITWHYKSSCGGLTRHRPSAVLYSVRNISTIFQAQCAAIYSGVTFELVSCTTASQFSYCQGFRLGETSIV